MEKERHLVVICKNKKQFSILMDKYYKEKFFTYMEWYKVIACGREVGVVVKENKNIYFPPDHICTIQHFYTNSRIYETIKFKDFIKS